MSDLKTLLTYKYDFGSLFYEPDSNGAEATVRLVAGGDFNQEPLERKISFFSSTLQDVPERLIRQENPALFEQLGKCRIRTAWVRYYEGGTIEFQVAVIPHEGKQRFYIRSNCELSEEQRQGVENQIRSAFRR